MMIAGGGGGGGGGQQPGPGSGHRVRGAARPAQAAGHHLLLDPGQVISTHIYTYLHISTHIYNYLHISTVIYTYLQLSTHLLVGG